jgi:raffinose/stachyose/melibiose transport system substrate-binding protein
MRRKLVRALLVPSAALLVAVAGCGGGGTSGAEQSDGVIDGPLRVAVPTSQGPAVTAVAEAFMQKYPDVQVDVATANTDQYQQTTRTQLASGTAPDVLYVWAGSGNSMSLSTVGRGGRLLADLSAEPWVGLIPESQRELTQVDGKTMILPTIYGAVGAIYNEQAFERANVTVPQTWNELLDACDKLNAAGISPFALGLQTPANGQFISYALVASTVYADHPDFAQEMAGGGAAFGTSGWRDAFEKYLELERRGCFQENPNGTPADEALRMVSTGEAAMSVQVNASLPQVKTAAPDGRFGFFALPGSDDAAKVHLPVALSGTYGISADSKNADTARAFLQFMAENLGIYASAVSTLPIDPAQTPADADAALQTVQDFVASSRTAPYPDQTWPNAEVQQSHLQVVQELFAGSTTVDGALQTMQTAYDKG